jgi:hypothetical protein
MRRKVSLTMLHTDISTMNQELKSVKDAYVAASNKVAGTINSSRLPWGRARVFIKDVEGWFREIPMSLDALFVDMNARTVALTWRGLDKIKEDDLADVKTALVASEPLADPPLAVEHYKSILEQFEADPLELKDRVPEEHRQFVDPAMAFAPTERRDFNQRGRARGGAPGSDYPRSFISLMIPETVFIRDIATRWTKTTLASFPSPDRRARRGSVPRDAEHRDRRDGP